jgi:DNA-binding MarR family transcriptional regulator
MLEVLAGANSPPVHCTVVGTKLEQRELRAWQGLLHAHHDVVTALDAELRQEHELTFGSYDVLLRLARAPGRCLRMTDLAERVLMSPSGLTRMVDRLESQGLVDRERFDGDARVMLARLTDRGRQRLRRAAATHVRGIRQHFTGKLSDVQLRAVAEALEVIAGPHEPH